MGEERELKDTTANVFFSKEENACQRISDTWFEPNLK